MTHPDAYRDFFLLPTSPRHRQYEILRARFVDRLPVKQIAQRFAVSFYTVQSLIRDFKQGMRQKKPPSFFLTLTPGSKSDRKKPKVREHILTLRARGYASTDIHKALAVADLPVSLSLIDQVLKEKGLSGMRRRTHEERERVADEIRSGQIPGLTVPVPAVPQTPAVADVSQLDLTEGRTLSTRVAGVFLFLPLLIQTGLDEIVRRALLVGSKMIPPVSYLLSLLALKLLDKERKSHITDWNFDEALGLFAGLNVLPKTTAATDYSYRLVDNQHNLLLAEWVRELYPILCPDSASAFALDFHAIPYRGDPSALEHHYVPSRSQARPSVLTCFARTVDSPMLCYANADIVRKEQASLPLRFVEYWKTITGTKPDWLYMDSRMTTYEGLDRLREENVNFITIRRRGKQLVEGILHRPRSEWTPAVIDTPKRRHQRIQYVDDRVKLRNYTGLCRQVSASGLGRESPTMFLTNNEEVSGREVIKRYTNRNTIENELGINVNFFHLDCLASEVRLNVNLDVVLTVIANGCYRWLSQRLKGCETMEPKKLYRKFVETSGHLTVESDSIGVRFEKRAHNPILRQAQLDKDPVCVPWLKGKRLRFLFP